MRLSTNIFLIVSLLSILFPLEGFAQADSPQEDRSEPHFRKGSRALQFYLINEISAAIKKHYTNRTALRLKFDISGMFSDEQGDYDTKFESVYDTTTIKKDRDSKLNIQGIDISLQYLFYPHPNKRINIFVGTGPFVGFHRSKSEYEDEEKNGTLRKHTYDILTYTWSFGITGIGGVESFITKQISLFADYRIFLSYNWQHGESTSKSLYNSDWSEFTSTYNGRFWELNLSSLRVGISIYF
ncbi:hypothetical protein ISS37_08130 [candidate division KSB1 bacterium]|nr:hypothetical protein [candidate division KSB1 bacterium]